MSNLAEHILPLALSTTVVPITTSLGLNYSSSSNSTALALNTTTTTTTTPIAGLITVLLNQSISSRRDHGPLLAPFQQSATTYGSAGLQQQSQNSYGGNRYGLNNWNSQYGSVNPNWPSGVSGEENWNSWNRVFKLVLYCFVSTFGSMGAIFMVSALTVVESLQVRGNVFVASLSFGHLLVTLAVLPASAIAIMANVNEDQPTLCHFQWLLTTACFTVTVLSFFALALDNFTGLSQLRRERYQRCCTKLRVTAQLMVIWGLAFALPWLQHHYQWGPEFCPDKRTWPIHLGFHPYLFGVLLLLSLITLCLFVRSLFRHKAYRLQMENSTESSFILSDGFLLKPNCIVYFVSFCMWMPLVVLMVVDPLNPLPQHYLDTAWSVALSNSVCFSYLYAATNRDFREAFNKLFYYCCCKSHVTFARKGNAMRRTVANESHGLRVHIIPGLNIYANRKETGYAANYGAGSSGNYGGRTGGGGFGSHPLFHKAYQKTEFIQSALQWPGLFGRHVLDRRHNRVEPLEQHQSTKHSD